MGQNILCDSNWGEPAFYVSLEVSAESFKVWLYSGSGRNMSDTERHSSHFALNVAKNHYMMRQCIVSSVISFQVRIYISETYSL